jgi:hypothetical protein
MTKKRGLIIEERPTREQCDDLCRALNEWRDAGGHTDDIVYALRVFVDSMIDSFPAAKPGDA